MSGGAAPFGPALIEKFMEKVEPNTVIFREGFGMTELSPVSHIQPQEGAVLGGCGHPVPNTICKVIKERKFSPWLEAHENVYFVPIIFHSAIFYVSPLDC